MSPDLSGESEVNVYPSLDEITGAAVTLFFSIYREDHGADERFTVVLAGGSTPRPVYEAIARRQSEIDWSKVHLFWGDERCVPPDHADSNYRMAHEALIQHVPIPPENVHRMRGEADPSQAASAYEAELHAFFDGSPPRFNVVLLGMGDEGHTASLFPGTAAIHEPQKWVMAHYVEKLNAWRLTMTPVIINSAREVMFLVGGANKAEALKQVLEGAHQPDVYPAQIVKPEGGRTHWLLDVPAARLLETIPNQSR